jgi:hypothetical protein
MGDRQTWAYRELLEVKVSEELPHFPHVEWLVLPWSKNR